MYSRSTKNNKCQLYTKFSTELALICTNEERAKKHFCVLNQIWIAAPLSVFIISSTCVEWSNRTLLKVWYYHKNHKIVYIFRQCNHCTFNKYFNRYGIYTHKPRTCCVNIWTKTNLYWRCLQHKRCCNRSI